MVSFLFIYSMIFIDKEIGSIQDKIGKKENLPLNIFLK